MALIAGFKSRNVWYDMADSYVRATEDPRRGARLVGTFQFPLTSNMSEPPPTTVQQLESSST